ncbi:hypothetical protein NMG60_11030605 [Bertholletia excelsa]
MIPLGLRLRPSTAALLPSKPPLISVLRPHHATYLQWKSPTQRRIRHGTCRAEFSQDAPFAVAIGACILSSLVFPATSGPEDERGDSVIDSADARFVVMGIISFIPYFNWLSWVFAWMDTGQRRYVVYSLVYLAPYLRSNFSLSPEDSWLPIASIVFCIIHIQLEASIKNGDFQGFQLLNEASKHVSTIIKKKETHLEDHESISKERELREHRNLPSAQEQVRNEIEGWGVPRKPLEDHKELNKDEDEDAERRKQ